MCSLEMVACCAAKSCGCGDDRADMRVGACVQGRDPQVGMDWIKKAAAEVVPEAQFKVGQHLLEIIGPYVHEGLDIGHLPLVIDLQRRF